MSGQDAYITLISSLPRSERLFVAKQPPLSRLRLEKRLRVLTPEDREILRRVEHLTHWGDYSMADDTAASIARTEAALQGVTSPTLRAIVHERIDLRAAVAALRMRRDGAEAPAAPWSASRLTRLMVKHWDEPTLGLGKRMPWLREAVALLEGKDPLALERHLLDVTFRQLRRRSAGHLFDIEAVVIYVLTWNIFERWTRADARAATARFEALAQDALGTAAEMSFADGDHSEMSLQGAA